MLRVSVNAKKNPEMNRLRFSCVKLMGAGGIYIRENFA